MNTYKYIAKDNNGQPTTGVLEAASELEAVDILHKKELVIVSIEEAKKEDIRARTKDKKIKADDMVIFTRQLATMIDSGIPLVRTLKILADQIEDPGLREVISMVREDIEAGMSFCDALAKHPRVFFDFYINMVRAGETSGGLDEVLDRLATYMEKSAALTRKIRSSLVYPAVVVTIAILITAVLLLKVVPTFKGMFESLGGQLPLPTQILIWVSDTMRKFFFLLIGALVIAGFLFKKYINTPRGRYNYDFYKLKIPVMGQLFRKLAIARFSRTFSTLVKSGVSILSALDIVSKTSGSKVVEEAVQNCSRSVRDGEAIAKPLTKSPVFPPMVCAMISIGEQTGQLEKMLSKVADFYDEQVDVAASALTSMIEPLVIAFLGVIIGGIVVALFLPIFKITQLISR